MGQRFRGAQVEVERQRQLVHEQKQGLILQFCAWAEYAQAQTDRFARLLFAVSCWRQFLQQGTASDNSSRLGQQVELSEHVSSSENLTSALATSEPVAPSASDSEWSGQNSPSVGQNSPSVGLDDLPGMSDPDESDSEAWPERQVDMKTGFATQGASKSLMTVFLSPVTSEVGADEGGGGGNALEWDFLSIARQDDRNGFRGLPAQISAAQFTESSTQSVGLPLSWRSELSKDVLNVLPATAVGQRALSHLDRGGKTLEDEALQLSEFQACLERFSCARLPR